jgi:hypothetical protein
MEKTRKDRLYEVMKALRLSDYRVYTDVPKITQNMMVKLRKGETKDVSSKLIEAFCKHYTNVSPSYLLLGEEPMFNDGSISVGNPSGNPVNNSKNAAAINKEESENVSQRREEEQECHESSLLDTINKLISIKTEQGVQERELLAEIQKLRDVLKDIISQDKRYQQMLDVNIKLQDMNIKLLNIIDRMTDK